MPEKPRLVTDHKVFHVWHEEDPGFDGNALYTDLDTAKIHAAHDYEESEYGWSDTAEGDDERPVLTWVESHGRWSLSDGSEGTGICVEGRSVYRPV